MLSYHSEICKKKTEAINSNIEQYRALYILFHINSCIYPINIELRLNINSII